MDRVEFFAALLAATVSCTTACLGLAAAAPAAPKAEHPTVLIGDDSGRDSALGRDLRMQFHPTLDRELPGGYLLVSEVLNAGPSNSSSDAPAQALPADAREPCEQADLWQRYRWHIVAVFAALVAQSFIIGGLLYERRRRRSAESESHQHLLEVAQMERALTANAISSSMAHELNQPLTAILSNAEAAAILLDADNLNRSELKEIIEDIRRDDQRAADIIKHLRMLLRRSDLEIREVDLIEVVTNTLALIGPQADENSIRIEVNIPEGHYRVHADYVHLEQVALNLVVNSIEAMRETPATERVLGIRLFQDATDAHVSIADTGHGIPDEKMATIFSPFVTTKAEGTGLGLSIARNIINTYGGRIWAEHNVPRGAVFRFALRLFSETSTPHAAEVTSA